MACNLCEFAFIVKLYGKAPASSKEFSRHSHFLLSNHYRASRYNCARRYIGRIVASVGDIAIEPVQLAGAIVRRDVAARHSRYAGRTAFLE